MDTTYVLEDCTLWVAPREDWLTRQRKARGKETEVKEEQTPSGALGALARVLPIYYVGRGFYVRLSDVEALTESQCQDLSQSLSLHIPGGRVALVQGLLLELGQTEQLNVGQEGPFLKIVDASLAALQALEEQACFPLRRLSS